MPEFFKPLLTAGGFIPHGHCYLWNPDLVWLHVVSDSLIGLAYYSIPFMLVYFVRKRRDVPFDWIFLMFSTFIVACGTTHLLEVWTLWHPTYWLSGFIKAITAVASLCTAVLLVLLIPKALALPSPAQLEAINIALRNEITQRKLAESALRESEERLQAFLNNAPAVIYLKDTEGRFSLVNREFENLFHVSKEQIVGKSDYELFPVPMAEAFRTNDQRALEAETPLQLEEVAAQDDGLHTYISVKFPLYNSSGVPYGVGGISTDITERKLIEEALQRANEQLEIRVHERTSELALINESLQAEIAERKRGEEALRRSQQRLSAIFNQAAVGIAQVGMDGQYLLVNQKLCDILGYTREELLEQTFQDLMHPDDQEANLKYSRQILSSEVSVVSREKCYICKDGSSIWINLTVSPIRDSSGEPKTFIGIVEDISDRKRVEQQIENSMKI
jgi:PAS domain S-box-containing protein